MINTKLTTPRARHNVVPSRLSHRHSYNKATVALFPTISELHPASTPTNPAVEMPIG